MGQILAQAEAVDRTESRLQRHDEKARGLWRDAWKRLRENKAAVVGLFYIAFMVLVAIFGPMLAPHDPNFIPFDARANTPPFWMEGSDSRFPLGTDSLARDFLSRLLYGARISMIVGLIPTVITMLIGVSYGLISGWMGGRADNLLMRLVDVVYAFPSLLLFIIMQASLRDTTLGRMLGGLMLLFVAFAITGWNGMARLVRGQVLSVREMEYVEAARDGRIITPDCATAHPAKLPRAGDRLGLVLDSLLHPGGGQPQLSRDRHSATERQLGQHGLHQLSVDHLSADLCHHAQRADRAHHDRLCVRRRRVARRARSAGWTRALAIHRGRKGRELPGRPRDAQMGRERSFMVDA